MGRLGRTVLVEGGSWTLSCNFPTKRSRQWLMQFMLSVWCGAHRFEHGEVTRHDGILQQLFGGTRMANFKAVPHPALIPTALALRGAGESQRGWNNDAPVSQIRSGDQRARVGCVVRGIVESVAHRRFVAGQLLADLSLTNFHTSPLLCVARRLCCAVGVAHQRQSVNLWHVALDAKPATWCNRVADCFSGAIQEMAVG